MRDPLPVPRCRFGVAIEAVWKCVRLKHDLSYSGTELEQLC